MPPTDIPEENHVMRYVRKRMLHHENGVVLGIFPQALELRENETYLSVTWLEHFDPEYETGIIQAAAAIGRQLDVKPKDGFAMAILAKFNAICASSGEKIRVVCEPEDENTGHVAIRRYPRDNTELFYLLALNAFVDARFASSVSP